MTYQQLRDATDLTPIERLARAVDRLNFLSECMQWDMMPGSERRIPSDDLVLEIQELARALPSLMACAHEASA